MPPVLGMRRYSEMNQDLYAKIKAGPLAKKSVLSESDIEQAVACISQIEADKVETVRLVFPDQHGILRGKNIVAHALTSAFASGVGMPSTLLLKDTSQKTVFPVWDEDVSIGKLALNGASDVLMVPRAETMVTLPWSPHSRLIMCDLVDRQGQPISVSSRHVLSSAISKLGDAGYSAMMGLEVEFQLYERIDDGLDHQDATMPPKAVKTRNLTQGGQFLAEHRYREVETILDELRRAGEHMGLAVRTMEIEMGASQFEFTFEPSDPMTQADRFVLFRTMVKEVSSQKGLHASFMAKPNLPNASANGWHMHQSLSSLATGENCFTPAKNGELTKEASGWIAGLLEHAMASCLFTTPTVNGYKRFAPFQLAPNRIQWGYDNRGAMVRALLFEGDGASRVENRVADPTANPYFAFAGQILSGLDGIERGVAPPDATNSPYDSGAQLLPESLIEALEAFDSSPLYRAALGDAFVDYLSHIKRAEWKRYLMTVSEWEQDEYFNLY